MPRITIDNMKARLGGTPSYDIANAIRNESPILSQYLPLANAENVTEFGAGVMINQTVQNEFLTELVNRIAMVVIKQTHLSNPLKKFKKGTLPMGYSIEEVFTDLVKEKVYDAEEAEDTVFKRELPDTRTLFHERNRQSRYDQTIQDAALKSAFTSWSNFDNFLASIINAVYNSAEVDEYKYMKLLLENYDAKNQFAVVKVPSVTGEASARDFMKKLRATAVKMTLPQGTRDFNAMGVHTTTDMSNLHLFIDADLQAEIDVDVLARAFNMSVTDFIGNVTVIDKMSATGIEAIMIDSDFFMVYDTDFSMETIRNPKGRYWNYFLHVWQILSVSRFSNAVVFKSGDVDPVTNVILTPTISSLKAGNSMKFDALVRQTDKEKHTVTYSVASNTGGTLAAGTAIDENGVLFVDATETRELKVTATVTFTGYAEDGTETEKTVTDEAIVKVVTPV